MSDQAPAMPFDEPSYLAAAGRAALDMGMRPRWKFAVHDGNRRRLAPRTPRPAVHLKIVEIPK